MDSDEKQFQKAIRHVDFFAKDVKEGVLLDEEEINVEEEAADEGQCAAEQGDDACI